MCSGKIPFVESIINFVKRGRGPQQVDRILLVDQCDLNIRKIGKAGLGQTIKWQSKKTFAIAGFLLTEASGIYPLIYCILASSFLCLLAAIYTIRVEIQMRGSTRG